MESDIILPCGSVSNLGLYIRHYIKSFKTYTTKSSRWLAQAPYAWAGIGCMPVFFALFTVSWVQWHEYREENRRLRTVADKHKVTTVMLNELHLGLAMTIGAYEKLTENVGADSTLTIFWKQVKAVRKASPDRSK